MNKYSPANGSIHFPKTIKELTQDSLLFESRYFELYTIDLYRLEDSTAENGLLWFTVRRGSYERINWLSWDEATVFIAESVIDEILKDEKNSNERR